VVFSDGTELDWACRRFACGKVATFPQPPTEFMGKVGDADPNKFHMVGAHVFRMIRDKARARPTDRILDIGSGCGRVAVYLSNYLNGLGRYDGFDIDLAMVEWCKENITARDQKFQFHHAKLTNTYYTEAGADAATYTFPFSNSTFDVVFAASVFTHLVPNSAQQYANEIARVLKPGGRALLSFYVKNDEFRRERAQEQKHSLDFQYDHGDYSIVDEKHPELAIAFEESLLRSIFDKAMLKIDTLSYGAWRKPGGWSFQDWVLVSKR